MKKLVYEETAYTFDIDYADGLTRPDTTIAVFDADFNLVALARDSNIEDDQPKPGHGTDLDDLSRVVDVES